MIWRGRRRALGSARLSALVVGLLLTISCTPGQAVPAATPAYAGGLPYVAHPGVAEAQPDPDGEASAPSRPLDAGSRLSPVLRGPTASNQFGVLSPLVTSGQTFRPRTAPPDRIVIPAIGLDARVIPIGTRVDRAGALVWETAPFAVGHLSGSANPGDIGNVVLSGHISSPSEGAVFARLPQLKVDDGIAVITALQPYLYRVHEIRVVVPSAVEVLDATEHPVLTLITCVPDGVYSHRLVVRALAV